MFSSMISKMIQPLSQNVGACYLTRLLSTFDTKPDTSSKVLKNGFFYRIEELHSKITKGYCLATPHGTSNKDTLEIDEKVNEAFNQCKTVFIEVQYDKSMFRYMRRIIEAENTNPNTLDFSGLDAILACKADDEGKEVKGFETVDEADSYNPTLELAPEIIHEGDGEILENYLKNNDFISYEKLMTQINAQREKLYAGGKLFNEIIIKKRNLIFANKMNLEMQTTLNPIFFMMGPSHICDSGEIKGVLTLLRERNWSILSLNHDYQSGQDRII